MPLITLLISMTVNLHVPLFFRVMRKRNLCCKAFFALIIRIFFFVLLLQYFLIPSVSAQGPLRPLIFIPGILGSKLIDENGNLIWGGLDSYANFHKLKLPRDERQIRLRPDGVIDTIPIVWPLKVKQYQGLLNTLQSMGYIENVNFYVFAYDWRRSNFKTARMLDEFIDNTPALNGKEFDIVAHSMGGLVSFILIHEYHSGRNVKNLVTLGTPFFGSLKTFDTLLNGFNGISGFMTKIGSSEDEVRSVMLSFESGYELLPTYTNCCVLGKQIDPKRKSIDIFGLSFWQNEWLPSSFSSADEKLFIQSSLQSGKKLSDIVRKNLPNSLNLYMYAGDKFETKTQVYMERNGNIEKYSTRGGDGTVWLNSACRNQVQDSRVSFNKHSKIFEDSHLKNELSRILSGTIILDKFAASAQDFEIVSTTDKRIPVELVSFEIKPAVVKLGDSIQIFLKLEGNTIAQSAEKFNFKVCIDPSPFKNQAACFNLNEIVISNNTRIWTANCLANIPGEYTVRVDNYEELEDYFAVVKDK